MSWALALAAAPIAPAATAGVKPVSKRRTVFFFAIVASLPSSLKEVAAFHHLVLQKDMEGASDPAPSIHKLSEPYQHASPKLCLNDCCEAGSVQSDSCPRYGRQRHSEHAVFDRRRRVFMGLDALRIF